MGRKSKYETHVQPFLKDIRQWVLDLNEKQIAEKLGISQATFDKYKKDNAELREVLVLGRQDLCFELKDSLRKKARGFYYTETKTTIKQDGDEQITTIEKIEKYAQPDTGAIHLLLKNLDPEWHNDDVITLQLKQMQADLDKARFKAQNWWCSNGNSESTGQ
jgi:hypothetical protein